MIVLRCKIIVTNCNVYALDGTTCLVGNSSFNGGSPSLLPSSGPWNLHMELGKKAETCLSTTCVSGQNDTNKVIIPNVNVTRLAQFIYKQSPEGDSNEDLCFTHCSFDADCHFIAMVASKCFMGNFYHKDSSAMSATEQNGGIDVVYNGKLL